MKLLVDPVFLRHPKVFRLAGSLGINPREARGVILGLWMFAIMYRENGDLTGMTEAEIAGGADWPGDPKGFIEALVAAGLLDREAGLLEVHDWSEHQGKLLATRERERAKKRRQRARRRLRMSPGDREGDIKGTSPGRPRLTMGREGQGREGTGRAGDGAPHAVPQELKGLPLYEADAKLCRAFPALLPAWRTAHPGVDVLAEVRKAHAWEVSNPTRAKKNRPKFLASWLCRAQDAPRPASNGGSHGRSTAAVGEHRLAPGELEARAGLQGL